ncbi:MAG TPA: histidine phosphatase family protein [Candidatus Dormibacteraeota bacterium]|nr:histidine phosphatase family protein [Candidatus Dormibacteraeota bacterium]
MAAGSEQITRAMRALEATFLIGVEGVTEMWLVRHADCYQDIVDATDPALSSLGREQAERLAKRVRRARPAAVYSSPFRRAMETAKAIGGDVNVDDRLVEMKLVVNEDGSIDLQEPPSGVIERMREAVDEMVERHAGQRIVAVSHGAAIIAYLSDVLRLEPGQLRVLPYYTSISVVRALGDRRMVGALSDTAHLE